MPAARHDYAQHQSHDKGGVDGLLDPLHLFGAVILGDDHASPAGKAHKRADEHIDDGGDGTHSGEASLLTKLPTNPCVYGVVKLLKDVARQKGEGEHD